MSKHIKLFLAVSVCAFPLVLNSTVSAAPSNAITLNIFQAMFGTYALQYETALSPNGALVIQGEFASFSMEDWSLTSMGGGLGYRLYPGKSAAAPEGVWIGPLLKINSVTAGYDDDNVTTMTFIGGAEFGYQWLFGDETAFALGISLGIYYRSGTISVGDEELNYSGILPGLGLNLGMGF